MAAMHTWEPLPMSDRPGDIAVAGRRLRVPGGWLYQTECSMHVEPVANVPGYNLWGYHPPVFVPDPPSGAADAR